MPLLAAALITAGTVLGAAGLGGFLLVWTTAPARTDLIHTRRLATAGRWAVGAGIVLLAASPASVGGLALLLVAACIALAVLTLLTKAKAPLRACAAL